jgi:hypothetical protein
MALDLGEQERALKALDGSISAASVIITDLIGDERGHLRKRPLRSTAALVPHHDADPGTVSAAAGDPPVDGPTP